MLEDYDALIRAGEVWVWDEGGEVLALEAGQGFRVEPTA